jgi:voltage-gated potassium channel Kch
VQRNQVDLVQPGACDQNVRPIDAGPRQHVAARPAARGEMAAGRLRRALVLNGDGTDLELLESEDIGRSDVLVSVIDNDERNLFASLLGRQLGVRQISRAWANAPTCGCSSA